MALFDATARTALGPADYAEGRFAYYNRSARPEVERVRELLERWVAAYPSDGRDELIARMREDHGAFDAAFFELFLFHLLVALDHDVALHPDVGTGTSKRPDFLGTPRAGGQAAIIEAVLATAESEDDRVERQLHNRIQDDINTFVHPAFFFILHRIDGRPAAYPGRAAIHKFLQGAVEGLDPDDAAARISAGESPSQTLRKRFSHEGLIVELYPWPKSPTSRGKPDYRSIGGGPVEVIRSTARQAMWSALKKKAGRYGDMPFPYVVAVNCTARWGVEEDEVREALLGREQVVFAESGATRLVYDGDGAFTHRNKPTNTRVSAALICRDLAPHSVPRAIVRLYHHLAPKRPYTGPLQCLPQAMRQGNVLGYIEGTAPLLSDVFGLWPEWPYEPGDARGSGWKRVAVAGE